MQPVLDVRHLSFYAEDGKQLLDDISFSIKTGEVVGLIGPNGAGKTSLLRCFYSSKTRFQGEIYLNGVAMSSLSERQRAKQIAAVTQESPADFQLSVKTVIKTGRTPHQHWFSGNDPKGNATVEKYVREFKLQPYLNRDIAELSGGERKRVMLCRALAQEPKLLLLDEPCNHLDIVHQLSLLAQIRRLPLSCLISLHDFPQAVRFCDRLLVMEKGRLVHSGCAKSVLSDELLSDVFSIDANTYQNPWQGWSYYPSPMTPNAQFTELTKEY